MQEVDILQYIPSNIKKDGSPPPPGGKLTNRLNLDIRFPYLEPDGTRVFTVPLLMSSEWEEGPCVKKFIGFKHGKGKTSRADGYVFGEWEDGKEISMM